MVATCPDCGSTNLAHDPKNPSVFVCLDCGKGFKVASYSHIAKKSFGIGEHMGKKLKDPTKWIVLVLGVIIGSVLNIYSFSAATLLLFLYMLFPNEFKIMNAAEQEYFKNFPQATQVDPLWVKEYMRTYGHLGLVSTSYICKFGAILLFAYAFSQVYILLALLVLFIGYFSFPTETDKKSQINEALGGTLYTFIKPIFGIIMAVGMGYIFSSAILGIMTFAFFVFFPQEKTVTEEISRENVANVLIFLFPMIIAAVVIYSPFSITTLIGLIIISLIGVAIGKTSGSTKILLFVLSTSILSVSMTLSNLTSIGWGLSLDSTTGILVATIWFVALLSGLSSTPASRPYVGMIMIPILLIAYTVVFPATVGTAVFGAWWPTIDSAINTVTAPLGDAFAQMQESTGSAFFMVTNPTEFYAKEMERQQTAANVKSGGTAKSIEVSDFEIAINNVPQQPLVGTAILENRGDFTASGLKVVLNPPQMKSKDRGIQEAKEGVEYKFKTCSGGTKSDGDKSCLWASPSYSGDLKQVVFVYGEGEGGWGEEIGNCECKYFDDKKSCLTGGDPYGCKLCVIEGEAKTCKESGGTIAYPNAGKTLIVGFNYSFEYIVNVSLDLQMMQPETLDDMLLKKQARLQSVRADYSGGPVKASISTLKQPVRAGEDTFATISIENTGSGTLKSTWEDGANTHYTKYILKLPFINEIAPTLTHLSGSGLDCGEINKDVPYTGENFVGSVKKGNEKIYEIHCALKDGDKYKDLPKGGESAKYSFMFKYDIPKGVDRKTVLFVGNVNYNYENSKEMSTQITWAPPQ